MWSVFSALPVAGLVGLIKELTPPSTVERESRRHDDPSAEHREHQVNRPGSTQITRSSPRRDPPSRPISARNAFTFTNDNEEPRPSPRPDVPHTHASAHPLGTNKPARRAATVTASGVGGDDNFSAPFSAVSWTWVKGILQ